MPSDSLLQATARLRCGRRTSRASSTRSRYVWSGGLTPLRDRAGGPTLTALLGSDTPAGAHLVDDWLVSWVFWFVLQCSDDHGSPACACPLAQLREALDAQDLGSTGIVPASARRPGGGRASRGACHVTVSRSQARWALAGASTEGTPVGPGTARRLRGSSRVGEPGKDERRSPWPEVQPPRLGRAR